MKSSNLTDSYARRINYLRLSVTDRCNLRCTYCMPEEGVTLCGHEEILSYEELLFLAETVIGLGIEKIRVTGGEPLARKGLIPFLGQLSRLPGLAQLVLTTNGVLLADQARELKGCGVQQLNISLDTLQAERFAAISRRDQFARVWAGIETAHRLSLPIKINVVVMRGINDDEISAFVDLARRYPWSIRFIEFMPTNSGSATQGRTVPAAEILDRIRADWRLAETPHSRLAGPARIWKLVDGAGSVGVISAVSCSFCADCNRVRVTSSGTMKSCLFAENETDLKPWLRSGDRAGLQEVIRRAVRNKPRAHQLTWEEDNRTGLTMSRVGG